MIKLVFCFFFFSSRRRHTRFDCDWSADVCSSDLGRAGHELGAVSKGRIFPKFRADLLESAVVAKRMLEGAIEETVIPRNPLDVLAQQIVAVAAEEEISVDDLHELVRGAYPFADLSRSQLENVLDMLAGRYPSDEFAELRPRIVWDRTA